MKDVAEGITKEACDEVRSLSTGYTEDDDSIIMDTGVTLDSIIMDTGVTLDGIIMDTGVTLDGIIMDTGVTLDGIIMDTGVTLDGIIMDTGITLDGIIMDTGVTLDGIIMDTGVTLDGTWQKRGFTPRITVLPWQYLLIREKFLDLEVMSRYCQYCVNIDVYKKDDIVLYDKLKHDHICSINHHGSAPKMEQQGVECFLVAISTKIKSATPSIMVVTVTQSRFLL